MNRTKTIRIALGAILAAFGPGLYATSSLASNVNTICTGPTSWQPVCVLYPWANGTSSAKANGASVSSFISGNDYYVSLDALGPCKSPSAYAQVTPMWTDGNFNYYYVNNCRTLGDNTADGTSAGPFTCNGGQNAFVLEEVCGQKF